MTATKTTPLFANLPTTKYYYANGKRKTSVARVRLYKGTGKVFINGKTMEEYTAVKDDMTKIKAPLTLTGTQKTFDIYAKVEGGGHTSQAEAIRHGVSKALLEYDPELRTTLKKEGFLTRDDRVKERKKYGLKKARRAPQWAKR